MSVSSWQNWGSWWAGAGLILRNLTVTVFMASIQISTCLQHGKPHKVVCCLLAVGWLIWWEDRLTFLEFVFAYYLLQNLATATFVCKPHFWFAVLSFSGCLHKNSCSRDIYRLCEWLGVFPEGFVLEGKVS